jgi:hypothetical protein
VTDTVAPRPAPSFWSTDGWRLAVLLLIAVALRVGVIANTTLPSRDAIVFVRYALDLEDPPSGPEGPLGFFGVIRANEHPPAYPLAILLVSKVAGQRADHTTVPAMALCAQVASALAGILLTIPFYGLVRRILDRNLAFSAAAVFGVLPGFVEVTSDGISDGLSWLTTVTALWFAARALGTTDRRAAAVNGFGAGLMCGLGYLVRPEAAAIALSIGLTFAGVVIVLVLRRRRSDVRPGRIRPRLRAGLMLVAGWVLVAAPYMVVIDGLSNKPSFRALIDRLRGREIDRTYFDRSSARPAVRLPLAVWWDPTENTEESKSMWALKGLGAEYLKASFYVLPAFGLIGLLGLGLRRRLTDPRLLLLLVVAGVQALLLWSLAVFIGYVSQRHTILIVLVTAVFAAAGFQYLADLAIRAWHTQAVSRRAVRFVAPLVGAGVGESLVRAMRSVDPRVLVAIWTMIVVAIAIPRNFKSLHEERAGHKAAGLWMKDNVPTDWQMVDPFGWAEWYTGRTLRAIPNPDPAKGPGLYVVFEPNAKSPHSRLGLYEMARTLHNRPGAEPVFRYPDGVPDDEIKVAVYRCPNGKP